jgi:hypothetical protein
LPKDDLQKVRDSLSTGFWIIIAILIISSFLGIIGILIEYTRLGNVRLSHEETNFSKIDIPMLQEGNYSEQLK